MLTTSMLQKKVFANQYEGEDALTREEFQKLIQEIGHLRDLNNELYAEIDKLSEQVSLKDVKNVDLEKRDLIDSMMLADELDSLDPVRYALKKIHNVIRIN